MVELLKKHINAISSISAKEWTEFESQLTFCEYNKGDFFVCKDKQSTSVGFIVKGAFRTFCIDNKGEEITYLLNFENEFLTSFESFLTNEKSKFDIQALEHSKVILIHKNSLLQLYSTSKYWDNFGRIIAERMYIKTQNLYQDLLLESAEYRYLKLVKNHPDIFNRVPLYFIASLIGIRPQSLTRLRKKLTTKI